VFYYTEIVNLMKVKNLISALIAPMHTLLKIKYCAYSWKKAFFFRPFFSSRH